MRVVLPCEEKTVLINGVKIRIVGTVSKRLGLQDVQGQRWLPSLSSPCSDPILLLGHPSPPQGNQIPDLLYELISLAEGMVKKEKSRESDLMGLKEKGRAQAGGMNTKEFIPFSADLTLGPVSF